MSNKKKKDFDKKSDICFVCNTVMLILLITLGALIMHKLGLELSASLLINILLFPLYGLLEERCISKYINISVKRLYDRFVISKR